MLLANFADEVFPHLGIKPKTSSNYRSMYKLHIEPLIGNKELSDIRRIDIQRVLTPLPSQTAAMTLAVMRRLFKEALAEELITQAPTNLVARPKIRVKPRKFLTVAELMEADLGKYRTQIIFLAMHGLRWGEAVALDFADLHDGKVFISKSIHGETKTLAGIRSVPHLSPFAPFPKSPKTLRKILDPLGIHIHSLRHTYAYLLKSSGVHVTTAQKLMGHADPKITLGIYTQFRDAEIEEAGEKIRNTIALPELDPKYGFPLK